MAAMSFDVSKVLGAENFTSTEADAILEIAYLTGVANGSFSRDELRSFRRLAHTLAERTTRPEEGTPSFLVTSEGKVAPLEELLDRYEAANEGLETSIRVAALAKSLGRDHARRAAYRISYALGLSDLESNADEEELEADLATALGLHDEITTLRNEVLGAVDDEPA